MKNDAFLKLFLLILLLCIVATMTGCEASDFKKYECAVTLYANGQYDEAIATLAEIEQYEDSSTFIMYIKTIQLAESGEYALAALTFDTLGNYRDSKFLSIYYFARQAENDGRYEDAASLYQSIITFGDSMDRLKCTQDAIIKRDFDVAAADLSDGVFKSESLEAMYEFAVTKYSNSDTQMLQDIYTLADSLLSNGHNGLARELFSIISEQNYSDSAAKVLDSYLASVISLMQYQQYEDAYSLIEEHLSNYAPATDAIRECCYFLAQQEYEKGNVARSYTLFSKAENYSDAKDRIASIETNYALAEEYLNTEQYGMAYDNFLALYDYRDSSEKAKYACYMQAKAYLIDGKYSNAIELFETITGYEDSDTCLSEAKELLSLRDSMFTVGNEIEFGKYEQDGVLSNGKEDIEWIILARNGENALLISKHGLDAHQFNTEYLVAWETCTLRKWLNNDFFMTAFSSVEQKCILDSLVDNSANQGYPDYQISSTDTYDKVYILSYMEAYDYYRASLNDWTPTKYAIQQGAGQGADPINKWWLRSPASSDGWLLVVESAESISVSGTTNRFTCVRPVIWVRTDSNLFR